jgi:hypothetical protein
MVEFNFIPAFNTMAIFTIIITNKSETDFCSMNILMTCNALLRTENKIPISIVWFMATVAGYCKMTTG